LSAEEIIGVGYNYLPYDDAIRLYNPEKLSPGYNGDIFFIPNSALGMWRV